MLSSFLLFLVYAICFYDENGRRDISECIMAIDEIERKGQGSQEREDARPGTLYDYYLDRKERLIRKHLDGREVFSLPTLLYVPTLTICRDPTAQAQTIVQLSPSDIASARAMLFLSRVCDRASNRLESLPA